MNWGKNNSGVGKTQETCFNIQTHLQKLWDSLISYHPDWDILNV